MKKNKKPKYPDGGNPLQTVNVSSGSAWTLNNQGYGSSGVSLEDPYAFSKKMGVTTLTPEQWAKLDAGQQQMIWRQGFDKAGFTQIGDNSFSSNGQPNKFAAGGNTQYDAITGALSPLIGLIPGGQFINMGLDLVGNFLPEKKPVEEPYVGPYAMGGRARLFNYEVEGKEVALGGKIAMEDSKDNSSFGATAVGPTHDKGGVDAGGPGFILSDRIGIDGSVKKENENSIASHARPIMKALSKIEARRTNPIDEMGKNILSNKLNVLKNINEKMLSLQEEQKKFYYGGPTGWEEEDATGFANNLQTGTPMLTEDPIVTDAPGYMYKTQSVGPTNLSPQSNNLVPESYMAGAPRVAAPDFTNTSGATEIPRVNGLNAAGMAVAGLGSLAQMGITLAEHRRNQAENPEQNFFEGIGDRAEATYRQSLETMNAQKMRSQRDINDAYGSVFFGQQGDSANVDRAMKNLAYVGRAKAIGDSNLNYDSAIADRKIGLSNLQFQADSSEAAGAERTLINKQQNLANLFTNLGANAADATGQALNAIKIAQNAKSQSQALAMLTQAYPNFTLSELNGMLQIIFK